MTETVAPIETWKNMLGGRMHLFKTDAYGKRRSQSLRSGQTIRLSPDEREEISAEIGDERKDPFVNGRLKRVDNAVIPPETPEEEIPAALAAGKSPLPEGHQLELANTEDELKAIFKKTGMAFQSAVKKLDERNVRALAQIVDDGMDVSVAQKTFLDNHIRDNFRLGGATSAGREILEERPS